MSSLTANKPTIACPVDLVEEDVESGRANLAEIAVTQTSTIHRSPTPTTFTDEGLRALFTDIVAAAPAAADRVG